MPNGVAAEAGVGVEVVRSGVFGPDRLGRCSSGSGCCFTAAVTASGCCCSTIITGCCCSTTSVTGAPTAAAAVVRLGMASATTPDDCDRCLCDGLMPARSGPGDWDLTTRWRSLARRMRTSRSPRRSCSRQPSCSCCLPSPGSTGLLPPVRGGVSGVVANPPSEWSRG